MACLVSDDLNIALSAVEVCKDKGAFKIGQLGAVTACRLALSAENVHQLVFHHKVKELRCSGGKLVVKSSARFQNVLGSALWNGVAVTVGYGGIGILHGIRYAQSCRLTAVQLIGNGHDILDDRISELSHVLSGIAVSVHVQVAQRNIIFKAHFLSHSGAGLYHIVVNAVKLLLMLLVKCAFGCPCSVTDIVIGRLLVG